MPYVFIFVLGVVVGYILALMVSAGIRNAENARQASILRNQKSKD